LFFEIKKISKHAGRLCLRLMNGVISLCEQFGRNGIEHNPLSLSVRNLISVALVLTCDSHGWVPGWRQVEVNRNENFGCGSSREHAPLALKGAGISAVVAKSFARIFFRNAINIGLPLFICPDVDRIEDGDQIEIDMKGGVIKNITRKESYNTTPLPDFLREIVDVGGLVEYTRRQVSGAKT